MSFIKTALIALTTVAAAGAVAYKFGAFDSFLGDEPLVDVNYAGEVDGIPAEGTVVVETPVVDTPEVTE